MGFIKVYFPFWVQWVLSHCAYWSHFWVLCTLNPGHPACSSQSSISSHTLLSIGPCQDPNRAQNPHHHHFCLLAAALPRRRLQAPPVPLAIVNLPCYGFTCAICVCVWKVCCSQEVHMLLPKFLEMHIDMTFSSCFEP